MEQKRYNVALIVASIMDPFSYGITIGAMAAAEAYDINLTVFPAKYVDFDCGYVDAAFEYQYNALLSYAAAGEFDYLVVAIGTIAYICNNTRKKEILNLFGSSSVLSVSAKIDGYDYIQYDNAAGITEAVDYLVRDGRRHICMMIGNKNNIECLERFEAYKNALIKNGIEYSDDRIITSDISEYCIDEAAKLLRNNPDADAVICVNDTMAATVCKLIKSTHDKIGDDIAVVGFDDLPLAVKLDPPLASVRADANKLGYRSIEKAVNFLRGIPDEKHYLETEFIPRESCMKNQGSQSAITDMFSGSTEEITEKIMAYVYRGKEHNDRYYTSQNFCAYIVSLVKQRIVEGFARDTDIQYVYQLLENFIEDNMSHDDTLIKIIDVLDYFCSWIYDSADNRKKVRAAEILRQSVCRKLIGGLISELNFSGNVTNAKTHSSNLVIRETLMFGENMSQLYAHILSKLYCLNINTSYLYLLEKPTAYYAGNFFPIDVGWSFKSYQYGDKTYTVPLSEQNITAERLYKNKYIDVNKRHTFVAIDLYSREYQYGMLLCEPESADFFPDLEFTVYQMSTAVKISELLNKQEIMLSNLHKSNLSLENMSKVDELTGIYNRRGFYSEANELIAKAGRDGGKFIVCYADMDNLKMVNDSYGHIEGDFSLKYLAKCLVRLFGQYGIVGRMGGDEYAAIIERKYTLDVGEIAKQKQQLIEQLNSTSAKPYRIDMSMGIYECVCTNSYDLKDAMDKADDLLYTIKTKRKKNIEKYEDI